MKSARERARLLSRRMEMLTSVLAAIAGLVVVYGLWLTWSEPGWLGSFAIKQFERPEVLQVSGVTTALLAAALLAQSALLVWALVTLRRAFHEIAVHDIVSVEGARWMRLSGTLFLANAVAMVLSRPIMSLILSIDMPAGRRFLSIGIGTPELLAVMVSGILIVFGHLLAVAAEIEDDNRQII